MTLVLIDDDTSTVVARVPEGSANQEHPLRDLIFERPEIVPVTQLEPEIGRVTAVAKELSLPGAGIIDVLLISEHGRLIVVECKLWRNPQARREVVGQILDYARELARYGYEDLQRVVSNRLGRSGNVLYELAVAAGSPLSEAAFVDRVARDLAAGRFLLLIAGDGITEGTQRIAEFLSAHAGLAFDLGLVEIAEYRFQDPLTGGPRRIVQPRLLARTTIVDRFVIRSEAPGVVVDTVPEAVPAQTRPSKETSEAYAGWRTFVDRFAQEVAFDDPAQMPPRLGGINWMRLPMPGPTALTLYRTINPGEIGAFLRYRDADGELLYDQLLAQKAEINTEFTNVGFDEPRWTTSGATRVISLSHASPLPWDGERETAQRAWLARVANRFVNSFRPRLARLCGQAR